VRAIVFDLDGTLVDSYVPIAASLNHARKMFGLPPLPPEAVRKRVGRGLASLIAELVGSDRIEAGVRLFRERYAEVFAEGTVVLPEVPETLRVLNAAGHRMGVASNKPAYFSEPILEHLGLRAAIGCVMGPDVVDSHKPEPTMIHRCLESLDVRHDEAVYVGDMVLDVESAARAGVPVLLVPGGSSTAEELGRTGQRLLRSFAELGVLLPGPAG
jgi:2-phosphoglycolate phosphatase